MRCIPPFDVHYSHNSIMTDCKRFCKSEKEQKNDYVHGMFLQKICTNRKNVKKRRFYKNYTGNILKFLVY